MDVLFVTLNKTDPITGGAGAYTFLGIADEPVDECDLEMG